MIDKETQEYRQNLVFEAFIKNPYQTIEELSKQTGISSSSCQRYLNLPKYKDVVLASTGITVKEQLQKNKQLGNKKGGLTIFETHESTKDEKGKFNGLTSNKTNVKKEDKKRKDIIRIVSYFSKNPYSTLDDMADFFNQEYTNSYIYDCLNDSRIDELFGKEISVQIKQQLSINRHPSSKRSNKI